VAKAVEDWLGKHKALNSNPWVKKNYHEPSSFNNENLIIFKACIFSDAHRNICWHKRYLGFALNWWEWKYCGDIEETRLSKNVKCWSWVTGMWRYVIFLIWYFEMYLNINNLKQFSKTTCFKTPY
jgi:hypothetical protein